MRRNTGNISKRPSVYSSGRVTRDKEDDNLMDLDSESHTVKILQDAIRNWPSSLKRMYELCDSTIYADSEYQQIHQVLLKLHDTNLSPEYDHLVNELLIHLDIEISNSDIPEQNRSDSGISERCISDSGLSYIPESISGRESDERHNFMVEHNHSTHPTNSASNIFVWAAILTSVLIMFIIFMPSSGNKEDSVISLDNKIKEWERSIFDLKEKFPSQNDNMWFNIISGVKMIVTEKPPQPSVFLLLHNDKRTSSCLANKVAKEAVKLLSESSQEPIVLKGEDLKMNKSLVEDYGLFSETYKHDIERKHVMIVLDIQEIPAVLARTFHVLCDVENPLVRDAAFLFTMQIDGNDEQKPTAIAEKNLKLLWKDSLDVDIMDPLITRVTNEVVSVKFEADLPC